VCPKQNPRLFRSGGLVNFNGGVSLYIVQQLLGHTNPRTTQRYAHLERDTLSQASEIAAQTVLRAVSG
jgi:integrase